MKLLLLVLIYVWKYNIICYLSLEVMEWNGDFVICVFDVRCKVFIDELVLFIVGCVDIILGSW